MTAAPAPPHLRETLAQLRQYVALVQTHGGCLELEDLPTVPAGQALKRLKSTLPPALVQYVNRLLLHGNKHPLTSMTRGGRCRHCRQAVYPDWVAPVRCGEVVLLCGCGALFVPDDQKQPGAAAGPRRDAIPED